MLTSTPRIGAPPDQERPCSSIVRLVGVSRASHGSSNALLTGWVLSPWYQRVFHGELRRAVETSIEPTHLMLATPIQPGTTSRAGKPWSGGSSAPFISNASSASSSALAIGSGRRTWPWSAPSALTRASRPSGITSTASARSPARSSTADSGTPRQRASPIAPSRHWVPEAGVLCWSAKKRRPLPAHSIAAVSSRVSSRQRSS